MDRDPKLLLLEAAISISLQVSTENLEQTTVMYHDDLCLLSVASNIATIIVPC